MGRRKNQRKYLVEDFILCVFIFEAYPLCFENLTLCTKLLSYKKMFELDLIINKKTKLNVKNKNFRKNDKLELK